MAPKIGSFLTKHGTEGNDYSFDIKSGDWHLGYGGDDRLNPSTTGYLFLDSKPYMIPAIISGGYGNDTYKLHPSSNVVIADNSTSDKDVLAFSEVYANEITVLFTIDGRHLFMQAAQNRDVNYIFPTSILILDALNSQGAIEIIEFKHINHSSFNYLVDSQSIGRLVSTYKTKNDQSLSEFLASGYINPKAMGIELSEVDDIISTLTAPVEQALPTYYITPSSYNMSEGSGLTTSVKVTNISAETTLYYSLTGNGITSQDFYYGSLTGSFKIYPPLESTSFSHTPASDLTTEGPETLEIKIFSDAARTIQVGSTVSVLINDTSPTPTTYTLTHSTLKINEGLTLTSFVSTKNVAAGTTLYYSLSGGGITASDFSSGALTGSGIVGTDGKFSISHTLANDLTTEGTESINFALFSDAVRQLNQSPLYSNNVSIVDTSLALTYYNPSSNNNVNTWTAYQVTNSVKAGDIVSQWFSTASAAAQQIQDISYTKLMDVVASTWADKVQINRVAKAANSGGNIEAKQIDFAAGEVAGSVISGGIGNDDIKGFAGWDNLEGGDGSDLIHGGNGRDIISGGSGRDELHGDFGWNTYRSEKDGVSDLIAIKSDHYLVNWLYGKAGNSPNGEKSDIIEGLDAIDKIKIIGIDTSEITFAANVITKGVTGIGIYGKGILEALYTGGDLTVAQITQMTSGDASAAAMSNSVNAYGVW